MKVINVVGARPNFMKVAPILREICKHPSEFQPILVHTGQHYDYQMSKVFFEDLKLPEPNIYLRVGSGTHAEQTGRIMMEFEKILVREEPDLVIVVGDVNSTLACALAAVKLHIAVAHVEAGLRSYDRQMPEEINRVITDAVADYLFTPTPDADENLKKEGITAEKIFLVGDVMVDSLLYNKEKAEKSRILQRLNLNNKADISPKARDYALLTLHRPSNVDVKDSLVNIITAGVEISKQIPVIFPAHPRTTRNLKEFNLLASFRSINERQKGRVSSGICLLEPLRYLDFLNLMMHAKFVMTDSGGIQEETTALDIPCLTLRNTTERPITLAHGTNTLVWNKPERIIREAVKIVESGGKKRKSTKFQDGRAAERIAKVLRRGSV